MNKYHSILLDSFKNLTKLNKNNKFKDILRITQEFSDTDKVLSPLQNEYIFAEIYNTYLHFGFALFSRTALRLFIKGINNVSNISEDFLYRWLSHVKNIIFDDVDLSNKIDFYNEEELENSFLNEFIKRIFCLEKEEYILAGMSAFSDEFSEKIKLLVNKRIFDLYKKNVQQEISFLEIDTVFEEQKRMEDVFLRYLQKMELDPLNILAWRLEIFTPRFFPVDGSVFIFREISNEIALQAKRLLALLVLLVPHTNKDGKKLLPDSIVSAVNIVKVLQSEKQFNLEQIRIWMNTTQEDNLRIDIEKTLEDAVNYGLAFKIPRGNKGFSYGLNEIAYHIVKPFHLMFTEMLIIKAPAFEAKALKS